MAETAGGGDQRWLAPAEPPPRLSEALQALLRSGDQGAWCVAALVAALTRDGLLRSAAHQVLAAAGVRLRDEIGPAEGADLASQAAAPVLEAACLLTGGAAWADQPDEALLAVRRACAQRARLTARGLSRFPGLSEALQLPGA